MAALTSVLAASAFAFGVYSHFDSVDRAEEAATMQNQRRQAQITKANNLAKLNSNNRRKKPLLPDVKLGSKPKSRSGSKPKSRSGSNKNIGGIDVLIPRV